MSTLAITASTSVRASHSGLPVSRAIRSAKASVRARTALAKRRSVSMRYGQRARRPFGPGARARSRPRHRRRLRRPPRSRRRSRVRSRSASWPVSSPCFHQHCFARRVKSAARASASPIRRIAATLASSSDQSSRCGDRCPDRLDLVDMHRAGLGVGPIGMIERRSRRIVGDRVDERREHRRGIAARLVAAAACPPRQSKKKRSIGAAAPRPARARSPATSAMSCGSPRGAHAEPASSIAA